MQRKFLIMIKEITVGVQRLISLPKYENVRYECSTVVTVAEGQTPDEAYAEGLEFCKAKVLAELDRIKLEK